eukprot:gene5452-5686_t
MDFAREVVFTLKNYWSAATWTEKDISDLSGKTIMVTGATDGVGFEAARAFATHGARVIIHGRNREKAERVVADLKRYAAPQAELHIMIADMTDFRELKAMADDYKSRGWPLHVLLNNAGIQAPHGLRGQKTPGGFEVTMSSNFFGPLYLTYQLLDVLKASAPSRLVWVNSVGSQLVNPPYLGGNSWFPGIDWVIWPGMNWDDLKGATYPDSDWWQYSRTKLMNLMVGKEMARRLAKNGVEVFVAHPGLTRTDHFGKADTDAKWSSAGVEAFANSFWGTEAKMGAIPLMYASTEPRLWGRSGAYIGSPELGLVNYFQAKEIRRPNAPLARDAWACRRLLDASLVILKELDPDLPNAHISPDGRVLLDKNFGGKVLPADGTSNPGHSLLGPKANGSVGIHDAQHLTGRLPAPRLVGLISPRPRFPSIRRFSSDTGAENDDQLVGPKGEVLQGKQHLDESGQRSSPMSEDKRGTLPEQGGAPEGDRAAAGQAYQPTGESGSAVGSPESGEKRESSSDQDASQSAKEEGGRQEDRTPLQGEVPGST